MRALARSVAIACLAATIADGAAAEVRALQSADVYQLRSVEEAQISPDGSRVAYAVRNSERPGAPYMQTWIVSLAGGPEVRLGTAEQATWGARWSRDGKSIAFLCEEKGTISVAVAAFPTLRPVLLAPVTGTNHPLPSTGEELAWSPDGTSLAFVSSTPGPETAEATGDPVVITRYLYKPNYNEGNSRFNDNRRTHIFVADIARRSVRQLTDGSFYEHSIGWSPQGDRILFVSNREADPDRFFNYDIFTVSVADGTVRRITDTKSAEYQPRWSPDGTLIAFLGTKRPLTSSETTMEDTHVWVVRPDGTERREVGMNIDNRQGAPQWSSDGKALYFTVEERGSVHLYQVPLSGERREAVVDGRGSIGGWWSSGAWSVAANKPVIAYAFATPDGPAELYVRDASGAQQVTRLNAEVLRERTVAETESFTFKSFDGTEIEAFLTKPIGLRSGARHPLIVVIHGGPHGQQGPTFDAHQQVYAGIGWATLMVNYRGSTGYGQKLADAIFKDQNGGEAKDVLAGVDAALGQYPWIDPDRLGIEGVSYGGQLTDWLITQTTRFKAAIPVAGISNLVSFNYMAYYHDYLAVEFGNFPHENGLMDVLWERSPIRYVAKVKTPTMLVHGENDNDVPIAEAEQYYIALKDVGIDTMFVRYPGEGHGIRLQTKHVVDLIERSIGWYKKYFSTQGRTAPQ